MLGAVQITMQDLASIAGAVGLVVGGGSFTYLRAVHASLKATVTANQELRTELLAKEAAVAASEKARLDDAQHCKTQLAELRGQLDSFQKLIANDIAMQVSTLVSTTLVDAIKTTKEGT